jgi:hypothetical protein
MQGHDSLVHRNPHIIKRSILFFGECFAALLAAIPLDFLWAKLTELFANGTAIMTRHFEPCLLVGDWLTMPLSRLDASNRVRFSKEPRWLLQATGGAFPFDRTGRIVSRYRGMSQ